MGRRLPGDEAHGHQHGGADPRRTGPLDRRAVRMSARKRGGPLPARGSGRNVPHAGRQIRHGLLLRHLRLGQILAGRALPARNRPEQETHRRSVGQIRPSPIVPGVVSVAGDQPSHEEHVAHLRRARPPRQGDFRRAEDDDLALYPRHQDRSGHVGRPGPLGRGAPPRMERDSGQHRRSGGHPRLPGRAGGLPRAVRLPDGEQGAGRQIRHGVLDQPRYCDYFGIDNPYADR